MIDNAVLFGVKPRCKHRFGNRHPDCGRNALTERPGGGFDAGGEAVFGVSCTAGTDLPERADIVKRKIVTGKMQRGIQEHRPVPRRQDEPVAVYPLGIFRIMP